MFHNLSNGNCCKLLSQYSCDHRKLRKNLRREVHSPEQPKASPSFAGGVETPTSLVVSAQPTTNQRTPDTISHLRVCNGAFLLGCGPQSQRAWELETASFLRQPPLFIHSRDGE